MKKIVIADDDFLVRTYIKQMLPWEKEGFTICGDAKNGKAALDIIEREHPDIILTDICMPVLDGLELIRTLKQKKINAHIFVLSCHDDFQYVKEAMKLGIDDYLLKNNLTPEALLQMLAKIGPSESVDAQHDRQTVSTEELAAIGKRKIEQDYYDQFDNGAASDKLQRLADAAGIQAHFHSASAIFLVLQKWSQRRALLDEETFRSFQEAFKDMIRTGATTYQEEVIDLLVYVFTLHEREDQWGILLDLGDQRDQNRILHYLQKTAGHIEQLIKRYFNLDSIICIAKPQQSITDLQHHWPAVKKLCESSFYEKKQLFFEQNQLPLSQAPSEALCRSGEVLVQALAQEDEEFVRERNIFYEKLAEERLAPLVLKRFLETMTTSLEPIWQENSIPNSFDGLCEYLSNYFDEMRQKRLIVHPAIRTAMQYICLHYCEDISQKTVADAVHLNTAYFSTLFKRYVGIGFSEYLTQQRLHAIEKRLLEGNERIKTISAQEGFTDYQYFCKVFKRTFGVSPSTYRQQHTL